MIRITLLEDFGAPVVLKWGYEVMVPMSFGPQADALTVEFSRRDEPLAARPLQWELEWIDPEKRSVILQDDTIAVHWFGDPRAKASNDPDVRDRRVPNFNDERIRVAMVWGDYVYSDRYGPYTSVRIRLPQIPKVVIQRTGPNGAPIAGADFFPHKFWRFEDLLAGDHEAQYADMVARYRPQTLQTLPFDVTNLSDEQLDAFAEALTRRRTARTKSA
jgi:hypothetical protein